MKIDAPQKFEAEFVAKKFKTEAAFDKWLKKNAAVKLEFDDHGQDFLVWWLDGGGEVLHCEPFQSRVWNGTLVLMKTLKKGACPDVKMKSGDLRQMKYAVKKLTRLTP